MKSDDPRLAGRCGSCARFARVREIVDPASGDVKRRGECLLGGGNLPVYETNTCADYVVHGGLAQLRAKQAKQSAGSRRRASSHSASSAFTPEPVVIPEELLDMDADEFRSVLRNVIREELGLGDAELGARWEGGELILKPGKEGTQEKRVPIESLFHKVVMIRDKLRVLEQKVNGHAKLSDEEKVQMQGYVTACYGSLTTFNVLFAKREDGFVGQKGDE